MCFSHLKIVEFLEFIVLCLSSNLRFSAIISSDTFSTTLHPLSSRSAASGPWMLSRQSEALFLFFLLPVFVFTDVQCGPRLSIHLKFTYSLLCHLHSTIESIQFLNFAYCYISIQNLYFITLFIICSFAETFLYFQSFENVCLCRNVSIIVCQIILTLALASVDLSFPLRI